MNNITYAIIACYPDKGMKSYGSKSLMSFNNIQLLDYQISTIHRMHKIKHNYEIIVICDFDFSKIDKLFNHKARIIQLSDNNSVFTACSEASYKNIIFIDYGCVFNQKILENLLKEQTAQILCIKKYDHGKLDVGCLNNQNNIYMYLDLPDNKFCNMFCLLESNIMDILSNQIRYSVKNLLYFEIINMLVEDGHKIQISYANTDGYIYFNNMGQKNAIKKFISKK